MDKMDSKELKKFKNKLSKEKYKNRVKTAVSIFNQKAPDTLVNVKSFKALNSSPKAVNAVRSDAARRREEQKRLARTEVPTTQITTSMDSFEPANNSTQHLSDSSLTALAERSLEIDRPSGSKTCEATSSLQQPADNVTCEDWMDTEVPQSSEKPRQQSSCGVSLGPQLDSEDSSIESQDEEDVGDLGANYGLDDEENDNSTDDRTTTFETSPFLQRLALLIFKHSLTDACAVSICNLVRDIVINKTILVNEKDVPKTSRTLSKRIGGASVDAKFHWQCPLCKKLETADQALGLRSVTCGKCIHRRAKESDPFIMSLSVRQLMAKALPQLFPLMTEKFMCYPGVISLCKKVNFTEDDALIVANTDGVEIARRSNLSIWPLLFFLYGIPDHYKQTMQNMFLAGFWHGRGEINQMQNILSIFVEQLLDIERRPIEWIDGTGKLRKTRLFLLYFCADTPAVVKAACLMHWGSENGCRYCLHSGQNYMETETYPKRTLEQYVANAESTQASQAYDSKAYPKNGVRGVTALAKLSYFRFPEGFPIDPMHSVFGGVFKSTVKALFKSKNACLGTQKATIEKWNAYIATITVPKSFKQYPRPWESRAKFKCHEWGALTMYYLPPVMAKLFKREYCKIVHMLIGAYAILTAEQATDEQLDNAAAYLHHFLAGCGTLLPSLGKKKVNFHYLHHYVDQYRMFGPLYLTSLRYFENANRQIVNFGSGNQWTGQLVYKRYCQCFRIRDILFERDTLSNDDVHLEVNDGSEIKLRKKIVAAHSNSVLGFKEVIYKTPMRTVHLYTTDSQKLSRFNSSSFTVGIDGFIVKEIRFLPSRNDVILLCDKYKDLKLSDPHCSYERSADQSSATKELCRLPFPTLLPSFTTKTDGKIFFLNIVNSVDLQYD